ncbi:MAG TPA: hypothetical protein PLK85_06280 [Alphaproteobacteria bacterium]|jgi:hypothetical protein|nr:hypothetical protein [Alphaproteobacteria bacterium]
MMVFSLVKYVLTAAFRDKILIAFVVLAAVGVSLSMFLGSSAMSEKDQFSAVFAAGTLRIGSFVTLILFVIFYIRKSFETRDVEYMLSRPVSRLQFLTAHSLSFSFLAFLLAVITTSVIFSMPGPQNMEGNLLWGLSLFVELVLVSNVALFFSVVLSSSVVATLATIAFYTLSRMIGGILGIIAAEPEGGAMLVLQKIMLLISMIIPRFDLMGQSAWLIYGAQDSINWPFILSQGLVFYGLVFTASYVDFKRKQF